MLDGRLIGLDYGQKRIGVALSDPLGITAQTLGFVDAQDKPIQKIQNVIIEYDVIQIVLGMPYHTHSKDQETELGRQVKEFAQLLEESIHIPIVFWDERFSSSAVDRHLVNSGVRRDARKQVRDGMAAAFMLQGYMESLHRKST